MKNPFGTALAAVAVLTLVAGCSTTGEDPITNPLPTPTTTAVVPSSPRLTGDAPRDGDDTNPHVVQHNDHFGLVAPPKIQANEYGHFEATVRLTNNTKERQTADVWLTVSKAGTVLVEIRDCPRGDDVSPADRVTGGDREGLARAAQRRRRHTVRPGIRRLAAHR